MLKRLLLTFLVFASLGASAELDTMRITLTNGTTHLFCLYDKPTSWFEGTDFCTSADADVVRVPSCEVKDITFFDDPNFVSIDSPKSDPTAISIEGRTLYIHGYDGLAHVHSISGVTLASGTGLIDLASLQPGVYILNLGEKSLKIHLK